MDLVPQAVGLPERRVGITRSRARPCSFCLHSSGKSPTMVGAERNDLRGMMLRMDDRGTRDWAMAHVAFGFTNTCLHLPARTHARTNSLILGCVLCGWWVAFTWYEERLQFGRWRSSSADGSTNEKFCMSTLSLPHHILGLDLSLIATC